MPRRKPYLRTAFLATCVVSGAWATDAGVDALVNGLVRPGGPGVAVMVRRDGRTVHARGYGAVDARTNFRLASVSKQFTAMAVMLLEHDGKLRFDQKLTGLVPGMPAWCGAITVRHLLQHTSGLPDYEELMETSGRKWTRERQISDAEVLELLMRAAKPDFAAGSKWAYSNSGYVVLGLIVARVSGQPFDEFLRARIFKPLGMRHTVAFIQGKNQVPRRAYGHAPRNGALVDADQSSTSATLGDGGIYSNLEDLARWDAALASHRLLDAERMRVAWTPARLDNGAPTKWPDAAGEDNLHPGRPVSYGFGWFLDPMGTRERMWHFGSTSGFRTAIERFPQERLTVIVLANRTDIDAAKLAEKIAEAMR